MSINSHPHSFLSEIMFSFSSTLFKAWIDIKGSQEIKKAFTKTEGEMTEVEVIHKHRGDYEMLMLPTLPKRTVSRYL